ncbi:MAG: winged helix-turn-helix transcriptional regulator [Clostridia bacterium]|nr:winged helix-turn-helix transcriptional regulator [Clostridia bacterium]
MRKERTAMMAVGMAHFVWEKCNRAAAARLGVPESYLKIILFLARRPGAGQKEIAESSHVSAAAVNQTVKEMIGAGFVLKAADRTDRRRARLFLTPEGERVAEEMRGSFEDRDARITAALTPEKERELIALLDAVRACLEEETAC